MFLKNHIDPLHPIKDFAMNYANRRRFPRHVLGNSSLIMCDAGSGEVIDISKSGLSFTPLTFKEWPVKPFKVDLLLNLPDTTILDITCSIVYPAPNGHHTPTRCGITFHDLSDDQKEHLDTFCAHYKFIPLNK